MLFRSALVLLQVLLIVLLEVGLVSVLPVIKLRIGFIGLTDVDVYFYTAHAVYYTYRRGRYCLFLGERFTRAT